MRGCFFGLMIAALVAAPAAAQSDETYASLLADVESGHTDIDYGQLRTLYAESPSYDPYGEIDSARALVTASRANDCPAVLAAANKVLDADFTDIQAHVLASHCSEEMNDMSSAKFHRAVAVGLLRSIAQSGDGTRRDSPYVVIAVKEEYTFLASQGLTVTHQSLIDCNGHQCDAMGVVDDGGNASTVYFDISRPMAWLTTHLGKRSER